MNNRKSIDIAANQGIAFYAKYLQAMRMDELASKLEEILNEKSGNIEELIKIEKRALKNLDLAEVDINKVIESNRGGDTGGHGFIAEFAEAGVENAKRSLDGLRNIAKVLNDNGKADLRIGRQDVQLKFYNNLENELKQAVDYRNMKMMFPKDHYEIFAKIADGETDITFRGNRLRLSTVERIKKLLDEESEVRGEPVTKWMKSSNLNYDEVQKGTIYDTLNRERESIKESINESEKEVNSIADEKEKIAYNKAEPTFGEATKVAVGAAAVQGGIKLGTYVYDKHKNGKEIWEFGLDEWKEAGIETGKGALKGGVSGYAMYGLTNVCNLSAPSASALVSGTFGLINATAQYRDGTLDDDEFLESVISTSMDATGAVVGAVIGQALIPIPLLGAVMGSIAVTEIISLGEGILNDQEKQLIIKYRKEMNSYISELDEAYKAQFDELMCKYEKVGNLQNYAFDLETNIKLKFSLSIELGQELGVNDDELLHNIDEIDDFFS